MNLVAKPKNDPKNILKSNKEKLKCISQTLYESVSDRILECKFEHCDKVFRGEKKFLDHYIDHVSDKFVSHKCD